MTVERNRSHAIDSDPTSEPLSPIEELPNEIFGKILACFPDLVGGVGAIGISAAIDCKKQLELTSKKICLAVNSPRAAALFMQAIWKKYVKPAGNFTYSELAILKEGVWDKVRGHSMHPPFEVRERGTWSPLEALPDEILRKIVVSLTEVRGEVNTEVVTGGEFDVGLQKKEVQKTIRSQINLGLASKRLHDVVHDGYTKRLFVHSVISKYQMLNFGWFVREVAAVREGISDYIRTHQLEKSSEVTTQVCCFLYPLVEAANQRLNGIKAVYFRCYLYDFLPLGFETHSNPSSVTFVFSSNTVRIYCPFVTLAVCLDGEWKVRTSDPFCNPYSSPHLIFLALVESLIGFFDAAFLGLRSHRKHILDEFSSWPDSRYYEISSFSQHTPFLRRISWKEMSVLDGSSAWEKRGSRNLIVCLNSNFYSVYQARSVLGKSIPACNINGFHTSPELIRLANIVRLTVEQTRPAL